MTQDEWIEHETIKIVPRILLALALLMSIFGSKKAIEQETVPDVIQTVEDLELT